MSRGRLKKFKNPWFKGSTAMQQYLLIFYGIYQAATKLKGVLNSNFRPFSFDLNKK